MIEDLKKSKNIGIIIANNEDIDFAIVNLAFILIAQKLNKNIYYRINNNLPFFPICEDAPQIILNVKKQISDIYYEKSNEGIKLFLTPKENDISLEDFNCKLINAKEKKSLDLVIAVGFKSLKDLERSVQEDFTEISKAHIINIDNNHLNKVYGNVNLIENGTSLAKILFKNLEEELFDENIASLLLAQIKEEDFKVVKKLTEQGAKIDTKNKILNLISILNKIELQENIYLAEIEELNEVDIPFILSTIKDCLFIKNFILIFNKNNCVFYLEDKKALEKIKENFNAQIKNIGGIFLKENLDKEEVLNILKQNG
ncbi:MAG: hypothetical protein PHG24_00405 [Candidatus Pacebacteria bacterium]|nr:hypothetical protein [Candidatus Paceibacterota bacterium]